MPQPSQPPSISDSQPLPIALLLFSVAAVFAMPVIVLLYAAHHGAAQSPDDLTTHARQIVERGQAVEAHVIPSTADQPGRPQ